VPWHSFALCVNPSPINRACLPANVRAARDRRATVLRTLLDQSKEPYWAISNVTVDLVSLGDRVEDRLGVRAGG